MIQASNPALKHDYLGIRSLIAQNSALLWSIDDSPGTDKRFDLHDHQNGYQLPIQRERQLSEDFAFLASHIKDPYRVMAVAIEEDEDKQGMTIRIATNKGELKDVQQGLKSITEILERAAARVQSRTDLQPHLLRAIVAFDLKRILSRLRSRHAPPDRHRDRTSKIHVFDRHINSGFQASFAMGASPPTRLQEQCERLKVIFDQFETMQISEVKGQAGHDMVADILRRITEITKDFDFTSILKRSDIMDSQLLETLPLAMHKLARYCLLSYDLIDAARDAKYSVFKTIRILPLDTENLINTAVTRKNFSFEEALLPFPSKRINSSTVNKARTKFGSLKSKKGMVWRVHAEIQLLSYYESRGTPSIPRVLSSSKLACYLCSLFIRNHGRFQVGGTHGKLYCQWTLPDVPKCVKSKSFLKAMHSLNQCLESEIRRKLARPLLKPKCPNESAIAINRPWSPCSTLRALEPSLQYSTITIPTASFSLQQRDELLTSSSHNSEVGDIEPEINGSIPTDDRTSTVVLSSNHGEISSELVNTGLSLPSASSDENSCFRITSDWTCFRMSLHSVGIWFYHEGLELFLDLKDDEPSREDKIVFLGSPADQPCWVGIKYIRMTEENQCHNIDLSLNIADVDRDIHNWYDDSRTSTMPLVLNWSDGVVVINIGLTEQPLDPFLQDADKAIPQSVLNIGGNDTV